MKKGYTTIKAVSLAVAALYSINTSAQNSRAAAPVKKVLLEEFTTGSCGNCPPPSYNVNAWHQAHPNSILMTNHEGSGEDGMSTTTMKNIFNAMHPNSGWFAPAIMINRGVYSINPEAYLTGTDFNSASTPKTDSIALRVMNDAAKAGVAISGTYNASTKVINASVDITFVTAVPSSDWRINLFLVEDSVVGAAHSGVFANGYDQHCYNSSWATAHYPTTFDGTSIISYPHRHVMRNALLGDWGKASVIPAVPVVGTTYSTSTTFTVPSNYKVNKLTLVAFVSSYAAMTSAATHTSNIGKNYVINANEVELSTSFATSIADLGSIATKNVTIDNLYPVPTKGETHLVYTLNKSDKVEITVTDILGHIVKVVPAETSIGRNEVIFNTENLATGMYYVTVNSSDYRAVQKLLVD
jgi:hypothetical protein